MASTYLTRTPSGSGSQRKFTFSFWVKRSGLSSQQHIFTQYSGSLGDRQFRIEFQANDTMRIYNTDGPTDWILFVTNRVFRDSSAWMHIVVAIDTTQSTESNRVKIYINGSQETSFSTSIYPSLNRDLDISTTAAQVIGALSSSSVSSYFDGSLTHFHFIDNTQYQASDFGETDSTSGIWKPKTAPSVTYGTNGFFLKMENSGAMGTDSSGNGNNFTVSGTLTQNVDTPSNNFATLNPLFSGTNDATLSNGNLSYTNTNLTWRTALTTLGVTTGKWYFEFKNTANDAGSALRGHLGCVREDDAEETSTEWISDSTTNGTNVGWDWNSGTVRKSAVTQYTGNTVSAGDICSIALDLDNGYIYFGKNGTWENSGDPTSGASGTGGTSLSTSTGKYWFVGYSSYNSCASSANFGQGYFGTTSVATANADDGGLGIMEYDVPANYRVLCTKNIKDYG